MRTVNVFVKRNRIGYLRNRQMRRQRLLQHDPVDTRIGIKPCEPPANFGCRSVFGKTIHVDVDADALAAAFEAAKVGEARFVLSDKDDDELGDNARIPQRVRSRDEFGAQLGGEASSVENQGRHAVAVFVCRRIGT
jgi:hypothetical protein